MKRLLLAVTRRRPDWLRRTVRATINDDGVHLFPLFYYARRYGAIVTPPIAIGPRPNCRSAVSNSTGMTTLTTDRNGVPAYIYHGQAQPAQDEAKQIEVELNWRYQHGDKSAELKEFWPSNAQAYCQRRTLRDTFLTFELYSE